MPIHFYSPPFYALNNLSAHAIEFEGQFYPTAEHAFQAIKCTDEKGKQAIREARSPLLAKELANGEYRPARDPDWDNKKLGVMESVLRTKLGQHDEVMDALKRSGTEEIVEDSPTDYFWGEGADGTGQNHMGKLWMKIRAELHS